MGSDFFSIGFLSPLIFFCSYYQGTILSDSNFFTFWSSASLSSKACTSGTTVKLFRTIFLAI